MSFNDVAKQRQAPARSSLSSSTTLSSGSFKSTSNDPLTQISEQLQYIQKVCVALKDKITELRRRKATFTEKSDLDSKLNELRDFEFKTKIQIENYAKQLDSAPRNETGQSRIAVGKLQKDHERLRQIIQALYSESAQIKVDNLAANTQRRNVGFDEVNNNENTQEQSQKNKKQLVTIKEVDIDTLIIEERERDIRKINQDIHLVNEMFKDMANIVQKQGDHIDQIVATTDESHVKAQQGLEQIKQASQHQSSCLIS